jgi:hypothetical protein
MVNEKVYGRVDADKIDELIAEFIDDCGGA